MFSISTPFLTAFKQVGIVRSSITFIPSGIELKKANDVVNGLIRIFESGDKVDNIAVVSSYGNITIPSLSNSDASFNGILILSVNNMICSSPAIKNDVSIGVYLTSFPLILSNHIISSVEVRR